MTMINNWWNGLNFPHLQLPKELLKNRKLSLGAVVLYSLMLDRARLSEKNNWADEDGNIYIYFTLKDIKSQLGICKQTAENYKKELAKANLISYRRKGSSDPDMITVLPFLVPELSTVSENHTTECPENRPGQVQKTDPNNTDKNYTEVSNIYQSGMDGYDYEVTKKYLKDITEYDILSEREYNMDIIDNYIEIMARTICSTQSFIMMGEEKVPASLVRSVFMKYTSSHLIYVYDKMQHNSSRIHNIHAYLLKTLYSAPAVMSSDYNARVLHDMPELAARRSGNGGCP